jgi:hypothetical protein
MPSKKRELTVVKLLILGSALTQVPAFAQQGNVPRQPGSTKPNVAAPCGENPESESKRLFGIVPNYRTSPCLANYKPLTAKQKFTIAAQDSFDRGTVILAAAFAGFGQLRNANPSFGQGASGYASYFGTSYADFVIGNFMTEGIFPSVLHQDPRYFRKGKGTGWSRVRYAVGQIFWTHNDSGTMGFNYSEVIGNSTAVAISNAYYPDNRDATDASLKLVQQLGVDAASNVLKEFWPEISRHLPGGKKP